MKNLVQIIFEKNFDVAKQISTEKLSEIVEQKLVEMKKMIMAKEQRQAWTGMPGSRQEKLYRGVIEEDDLEEAIDPTEITNGPAPTGQRVNQSGKGDKEQPNTTVVPKNNMNEEELDEARIKIVKARIRGGKIQRRKKVSNVPGMTFRGGKLTRMSPAERRRRKMGQRKGKMKRRAKMARTLMKRRRSIQKRRTLGLG